jgi:hypothetical protein
MNVAEILLGSRRLACAKGNREKRMKPAGRFSSQLQLRRIFLVLVLPILLALGACASPSYPLYQPIATSGSKISPQQGYSDYQIDERTYLITYQGFNPDATRPWRGLSHEEWIEMAHDYVLYRSAELARDKGAKRFVILHRDDSNQSWRVSVRDTHSQIIRGYIPSARALIRILADDKTSIVGSEGQVHEVNTLITRLVKSNLEVAKQQGVASSPDNVAANEHRFFSWRVPVLLGDSALESSLANRKSSLLDTEITEDAPGVFGIVQWSRLPLSPIDLLRQAVKLADQEGYAVFKLENWTTEEYRRGRHWNNWNDWSAWFRTKARLVLQHQSEPNNLAPVFIVDEIRENVMR